MEKQIITNVQIENRKDSYNNWQNANPILLNGEIGLVQSSPTYNLSLLVMGNGVSNFISLLQGEQVSNYPSERSVNHAVFYSGIGAGYVLPTASSSQLGGIKYNPQYFGMLNDQLIPTVYDLQYIEGHGPAIVIKDEYSLKVKEIITTEAYEVEDFYIDLNQVITEGMEPIVMSETNPYSGMIINNYKKVGTQYFNAFMGMDYTGKPVFSTSFSANDYGTAYPSLILTLPYDQRLSYEHNQLVTYNNDSISLASPKKLSVSVSVDNAEATLYEYDPLSAEDVSLSLNTMSRYCTKIYVNDTLYELGEDGQTIDLGSSIWTDDKNTQLNDATADIAALKTSVIKNIQFNGTSYTADEDNKVNIEISPQDLVPIASDDESITVTYNSSNNSYNLQHGAIEGTRVEQIYQAIITEDESSGAYKNNVLGLIGLEWDDKGHITNIQLANYSFEQLLQRIATLEAEVRTLKGE